MKAKLWFSQELEMMGRRGSGRWGSVVDRSKFLDVMYDVEQGRYKF